jgi:transposase
VYYGLDVHKEFVQVCELTEDGKSRRDYRIDGSAEAVEAFAQGPSAGDAVVLEATFHTWALHAILTRYAGRVAVANPGQVKAIAHARIKTDKVDAHTLAQLLRLDFLPEVQMPSRRTWALRQLLAHRRHLNRQLTATKSAIHALLNRSLIRYPGKVLFSKTGIRWLEGIRLPATERLVLDHQIATLREVETRRAAVDDVLLDRARLQRAARLLVTIPGVDVTVAVGFLAAIGSIERFESPQKLAAYFGLVPRIRQSAGHCWSGHITKAGSRNARWLAIEAAQTLARSQSPLAASYHRIRRRKGHQVAVTALARKLVVVTWHVLTKDEPYRYGAHARTREKLKKLAPSQLKQRRWRRAPQDLAEVYREAHLELSSPSAGERRAARNNRIAVAKFRASTSATPAANASEDSQVEGGLAKT